MNQAIHAETPQTPLSPLAEGAGARAPRAPGVRPYAAPVLVSYGSVGALTRGSADVAQPCNSPSRSDCVGLFGFSP